MSDYYTRTPFTKGTLVRSAEANAQLQAIEEGFDKLPTEEQLKRNTTTFAVDTGTVNHLIVALPFPLLAYPGPGEGLEIAVQVANTNTGEADIDVDTLGVVPVKQFNGNALEAGDLPAGATVKLSWNGDDNEFRLQGASPGNIVAAEASAAAAAASASAAAGSASAASGSASTASGHASTASGHATNASDSADAAAISASAASDSADAAASSASDAADSAAEAAADNAFGARLLHVRDQKAANTAGGTFSQGDWRTRNLTTSMTNEISGASLGSNQITLPAGTYYIDASAPGHGVDTHVAKLRNTTDAADTLIGTASIGSNSGDVTQRSFIAGRFTIAAPKVFEIQHRCLTTRTTNGFGNPCNFGVVEVYTDVRIWKVA